MLSAHAPAQLCALAQHCQERGDLRRAYQLAEHARRRGYPPAKVLLGEILLVQQLPGAAQKMVQGMSVAGLDDALRRRLVRVLIRTAMWSDALAIVQSAPAQLEWLLLRLHIHHELGHVPEAAQTRAAILDTGEWSVLWLQRQAEALWGQGDPGQALRLVDTGLQRFPQHRPLTTLRVALLIESGPAAEAIRALDDWEAVGCTWEEMLRTVPWRVRLMQLDVAERVVEWLCAQRPGRPEGLAWSARFALWRGDADAARMAAQAACQQGTSVEAVRTLAAADVLAGEWSSAIVRLEQLVAEHPADAVAWCWYSEALRHANRLDAAVAAADQAMSQGLRFGLTPRINRFLALHELARKHEPMDSAEPRWAAEIFALLTPMGFQTRHGKKAPLLVEALTRFGGNRTADLSTWDGQTLQPYPRPPDPRSWGRRCQKLLSTQGLPGTLDAFGELLQRFPAHPLVHTYRGEVHLWSGQYEKAKEDFLTSLRGDNHTLWAWIGLGAAALLMGDPQAAIDTFAEGVSITEFEGPTLFIYRAEAWLCLGEHRHAEADLREALRQKPQRLSTWMHLALLDADRGDDSAARALLACIAERLPGLSLMVSATEPAACLRQMLTFMRGNRSSSLITWLEDGRLRMGSWSALPRETVAAFSHWLDPAVAGG